MILAAWAAIAIENARLYESVAARRDELEHSTRRLEAARAIAVAVGAEMELEPVLELIAKRGRALVEARSLVILLREGADLVVAASAGVTERATGARVPIERSTTGQVLETRDVRADRRRLRRTCGSRPAARRRRRADRAARAARLPRPRSRACSPRSTAARDAERFSSRGRGDAAGVRRQRRDRGRARADRRSTSACATRWMPPRPSAGAGRASCTTRRCRASAGCASCSRRRCASADGGDVARAAARGRRAGRARDREPARDHHRPASGGARRARARARRSRRSSARLSAVEGLEIESRRDARRATGSGSAPSSRRRSTGSSRRR